MTAEIAIRTTVGMTFPQKLNYSTELANSSMLPKQYQKQPANILFALEYAEALGLPPISAITSIYVVEGKPTASADLIASMVRKAGHKLRVSGDDTFALAQIIRADDPDFTYESRWDMAKAQKAGLAGKGVWKSYPGAMLRSRAITEVARMGASDSLYGVIYTPEELGAEVNAEGAVLAPSARQDRPTQEAPRSASERLRAAVKPATTVTPGPIDAPEARERARKGAADEPPSDPPVDTATGEVLDAEIVADPITPRQLTALNAALTVLGFTEREDKIAHLSAELGRDIESSKDLTKDEASLLINKIKAHEVPVAPASAPSDTFVEEPPADWEPAS